jgi:hypothetical protein
MIANGLKQTEYRGTPPPKDKFNVPIYILSKGRIYAKVKIKSYFGNNTKFNYAYDWNLELLEAYKPPLRYIHPRGAQKWVKNVTLSSQDPTNLKLP